MKRGLRKGWLPVETEIRLGNGNRILIITYRIGNCILIHKDDVGIETDILWINGRAFQEYENYYWGNLVEPTAILYAEIHEDSRYEATGLLDEMTGILFEEVSRKEEKMERYKQYWVDTFRNPEVPRIKLDFTAEQAEVAQIKFLTLIWWLSIGKMQLIKDETIEIIKWVDRRIKYEEDLKQQLNEWNKVDERSNHRFKESTVKNYGEISTKQS
jgi:hypothetical protein